MDIISVIMLGLAWIIPIAFIVFISPHIKRILYRRIHKNYIVCHMFAKVGTQYMEIRTNLIPVGVKTFRNDKREYFVDPDRIMWRPTGLLGGNEMHLYYTVGKTYPISFTSYRGDKSALIAYDTMHERIFHNFLTATIPKMWLYVMVGMAVVIIIMAFALMYLIMNPASTGAIPPPPR